MLTFATTIALRDKIKADIKSKWEITDLRVPTKIIGIELTISPDKIFISSSKYIKSILLREGLGQSNSVSTPLDPNITLVPNPDGNVGDRSNAYASLLGKLQYITTAMCPDIAYTVNQLASYTANPSLQHHTALKQILRYLSGTKTHGITYKAVEDRLDFFHGYADAAYANADDYKSTSSYVFITREGAITWSSKKQISTASSSMHVEYVALSEASREACWLRNLYTKLGLLQEEVPMTIHGDNNGSVAMANNPQFHSCSKHIALCWHWIQELVQENTIHVDTCRDPDQTVDILTKALPCQKHVKHVAEMGLASA
jgi:hypothetical protein